MEQPLRKRMRKDDETGSSGSDLFPHLAEAANGPSSSSTLVPQTLPPPTASDILQGATRDSDFWFEDGNIILVAGSVAFRVYKGLLAEHSTVFGNMFDVAQAPPDPSADMAEGCPVVPLFDSPSDLRGLFRLIYPLSRTLQYVPPSISHYLHTLSFDQVPRSVQDGHAVHLCHHPPRSQVRTHGSV